jgi:hypothetical protein
MVAVTNVADKGEPCTVSCAFLQRRALSRVRPNIFSYSGTHAGMRRRAKPHSQPCGLIDSLACLPALRLDDVN